jgi:hypothetical protein
VHSTRLQWAHRSAFALVGWLALEGGLTRNWVALLRSRLTVSEQRTTQATGVLVQSSRNIYMSRGSKRIKGWRGSAMKLGRADARGYRVSSRLIRLPGLMGYTSRAPTFSDPYPDCIAALPHM